MGEVGLFKLRGHKDQITASHFLQPSRSVDTAVDGEANGVRQSSNGHLDETEDHAGFLLTTSKDALIKFWDLGSQHCIETHVAQSNGECWSMGVSPDQSGCITAGNDGELRIWAIDVKDLGNAAEQITEGLEKTHLREKGTLYRQGKDRTLTVSFHPGGNYIAAHGSEKAIELWRVRSETEIQKTMARKRKRRREKLAAAAQDPTAAPAMANVDERAEDISTADVADVIVPYVIVRTSGKIRSIDWAGGRVSQALQLLASTANNQLEVYSISTKHKEKKADLHTPRVLADPFTGNARSSK